VLFVSTHYSILSNEQEATYGDTLNDTACAETSRRMFGTVYLERTWVRIGYDTCCRQVAQRRLGTGSYISDWKELDPGLE
jgi:hypothetical protein